MEASPEVKAYGEGGQRRIKGFVFTSRMRCFLRARASLRRRASSRQSLCRRDSSDSTSLHHQRDTQIRHE